MSAKDDKEVFPEIRKIFSSNSHRCSTDKDLPLKKVINEILSPIIRLLTDCFDKSRISKHQSGLLLNTTYASIFFKNHHQKFFLLQLYFSLLFCWYEFHINNHEVAVLPDASGVRGRKEKDEKWKQDGLRFCGSRRTMVEYLIVLLKKSSKIFRKTR